MKIVKNFFSKALTVAGTLVFSQIPAYMHQYHLLLKGHLDELNLQIHKLNDIAGSLGKTLNEYIQKFLTMNDVDIHMQGIWMQDILSRQKNLMHHFETLNQTAPWLKPFVFMKHADWTIFKQTWEEFTPSVNFNLEGIIYIVLGAFCGSLVFMILEKLAKLMNKSKWLIIKPL